MRHIEDIRKVQIHLFILGLAGMGGGMGVVVLGCGIGGGLLNCPPEICGLIVASTLFLSF